MTAPTLAWMTDEAFRKAGTAPDPGWLAEVEQPTAWHSIPRRTLRATPPRAKLLANLDMCHLGTGPSATGGSGGWSMQPTLYFRCVNCGYYMSGDPDAYDECHCGYLAKDRDAGRFGSALGDDAIEVFRATVRGADGP